MNDGLGTSLGWVTDMEADGLGLIPDHPNTQGLKITEEEVVSCNDIYKWLDNLVFLDKDDKLEVLSHYSFT